MESTPSGNDGCLRVRAGGVVWMEKGEGAMKNENSFHPVAVSKVSVVVLGSPCDIEGVGQGTAGGEFDSRNSPVVLSPTVEFESTPSHFLKATFWLGRHRLPPAPGPAQSPPSPLRQFPEWAPAPAPFIQCGTFASQRDLTSFSVAVTVSVCGVPFLPCSYAIIQSGSPLDTEAVWKQGGEK